MAGDWIKMRPSLLTSPKVNCIARLLEENEQTGRALSTGFNGPLREIVTRSVMRHVTLAGLLVIWGAANEHTRDGVFNNADLSDLDDMAGVPGFGDAMAAAGWAVYNPDENSVTLPNFCEYNTSGEARSANAKSAAQRQREYRERQKAAKSVTESDVTGDATGDVTSNRREEKRREEKKEREPRASRLPRPDDVSEATWNDWLALRKSKKAPVTETVLKGARAEAQKAQMPLEAFLQVWCMRGSQGLQADWLKPEERPSRGIATQQAPRHYEDAEETRRKLDESRAKTAPPSPEIKARIAQVLAGKVLQ